MFAFIRLSIKQWLLERRAAKLERQRNEAIALATFGENWEWFQERAHRHQFIVPYSWSDWWDVALLMGRYIDTSTIEGEDLWLRRMSRIIDRCQAAGWPPDPRQIARQFIRADVTTPPPSNPNQGDPPQT
jgi:hypothetical protein